MLSRETSLEVRMPTRLSISSLCAALLVLAVPAPSAFAQGFFVTPVPGAPFSAVVNIERTSIRQSGLITQFKSMMVVARDGHGRIHNELRPFIAASRNETPELLKIHLYDPQTRISTQIDVQKRTYWTMTVNHPPATEPPSIGFAAPDGNLPANEFAKQEDLGMREIDGVQAHGMRREQAVVTDEYWYSQDLRINLVVKHSDPRSGTNTLTVTQVTRTEPDPKLFEVPEGYSRPGGQAIAGNGN